MHPGVSVSLAHCSLSVVILTARMSQGTSPNTRRGVKVLNTDVFGRVNNALYEHIISRLHLLVTAVQHTNQLPWEARKSF